LISEVVVEFISVVHVVVILIHSLSERHICFSFLIFPRGAS
jgi:hypothetical protein